MAQISKGTRSESNFLMGKRKGSFQTEIPESALKIGKSTRAGQRSVMCVRRWATGQKSVRKVWDSVLPFTKAQTKASASAVEARVTKCGTVPKEAETLEGLDAPGLHLAENIDPDIREAEAILEEETEIAKVERITQDIQKETTTQGLQAQKV